MSRTRVSTTLGMLSLLARYSKNGVGGADSYSLATQSRICQMTQSLLSLN